MIPGWGTEPRKLPSRAKTNKQKQVLFDASAKNTVSSEKIIKEDFVKCRFLEAFRPHAELGREITEFECKSDGFTRLFTNLKSNW